METPREDNQETVEPYVEKLDDKIKKLNSTRVYKKITPKGDITWYVKWVSTILVIVAVLCRSLELHIYDMMFSLLGVIGWTFVGLKWHDRNYNSEHCPWCSISSRNRKVFRTVNAPVVE